MTKPTDKDSVYVAMDSQSTEGHKLVLRKSLATAHHGSLLKPAQPAPQPVAQQSPNTSNSSGEKPTK